MNETHETPKFHGGNVSATQFLDSFRIYLSIRSVKERCTNIVLKVGRETERMGANVPFSYSVRRRCMPRDDLLRFEAVRRGRAC